MTSLAKVRSVTATVFVSPPPAPAGLYRVAKLDVDANPRTSAALGIQSIPTLFIYKNGQPVERIVGAQPKHVLAARLSAHL